MKGWIVSDKNGDYGCDIVFADTRGKAIVKALGCDSFEDLKFTDIRVRRCPEIDGMENNKPTDNYWLNDEIRMILVKEYDLRCLDPRYEEECRYCIAKEYCCEWEYYLEELEENEE